MKFLIIGDSHTGPIKRGWQRLKAEGALHADVSITVQPVGSALMLAQPFWKPGKNCAQITNPTFRRRITRIPPWGDPPDIIGLCMPYWSGRVIRRMGLQNLTLHGIEGEGRLISAAVFRQMVLADQKHILTLTDHLLGLGHRMVTVAPPGYFRDFNDLPKLGQGRLLGLDHAYRAVMRDQLQTRAIPIIETPDACFDPQGFMLSSYRNEDPADTHHGNAEYGALMIREIERWALAQPPA